MRRRTIILTIIGVVLSVVFLYLAFRNVPLPQLLASLRTVNYIWIVPTMMLVVAAFALRSLRWQIILHPVRPLAFRHAYHPLIIGFMVNCVLPGRLGELARPAILQRRQRVSFVTGLSTVAIERLFDLIMMIVLLAAAFRFVEFAPDVQTVLGRLTLNQDTLVSLAYRLFLVIIVLLIGITLINIKKFRYLMVRLTSGFCALQVYLPPEPRHVLQERAAAFVGGMMENIARGFHLVRRPGPLLLCSAATVVIWVVQAASYYTMALGFPGLKIGTMQSAVVMVVVCFFIILPSVPGYWGLWEAGGVFALSLFRVPADAAAAYTLLNHAVQIFPVIAAGLVSAAVIGFSLRRRLPLPATGNELVEGRIGTAN